MKKILIFLIFILAGIPVIVVGQIYVLSGMVVNQAKSNPIAFVKIGINNNKFLQFLISTGFFQFV